MAAVQSGAGNQRVGACVASLLTSLESLAVSLGIGPVARRSATAPARWREHPVSSSTAAVCVPAAARHLT
jgi:hypothetical protein